MLIMPIGQLHTFARDDKNTAIIPKSKPKNSR
jgi:hypothetical protein